MADPVSLTLLAVGTGATIAGGVTSAMGAKYAGEAKGRMYDYQAGLAEINKKIELGNAEYARSKGEVDASIVGVKGRQQMGLIKSAQGASGVDANSGSSEQVRDSQRGATQFDESMVRSNAARVAYGHEIAALGKQGDVDMAKMGAETSRTTGDIQATASILGTVGSVASKWYQASPGMTGSENAFLPSTSFADHGFGFG